MGAFCLVFCAFTALAAAATVDKVSEQQNRFDKENRAPAKVKDLEKLEDAQFSAINMALDNKDYIKAGLILEKFRDNTRTCLELLKKQVPNADRHSEPYRHLELMVRSGIRQVEEILLVVPFEVKPPVELVRQDLITIDDELIHLLFPTRMREDSLTESEP